MCGIRAPESGSTRVRLTLVVANDPKLVSTKTGTAKVEVDCQNDDEEGVRIVAWRNDADELATHLRKGYLVQFSGLSVKKVFNYQYTYGVLPYELHYTSGNGGSSSYFVAQQDYRIAGMPLAAMHELDADLEFLRSATLDRRVRIRRIKAVVADVKLQQFCKGVIGLVIAYDPANRNRTLTMKLQIDFVPEQHRQQFVRGCKLEVRGKLSLPQLEGSPVEFKVERYEDVDLGDNGVIPWLKGEKPLDLRHVQANRSAHSSLVSKPTEQSSRKAPTAAVAEISKRKAIAEASNLTYFKGVVVKDFEAASDAERASWGLVYVKEMQTAVSVIVSAVADGQLDFCEATMVEMRGELKSDGDGYQVLVQYPAIAKLGELPKPKAPPKPRVAAAKRARYADLQTVSSILRIVEGKVMDVETNGDVVMLDLFVKDSTGKGIVPVVVQAAVADARSQAVLNKQVDVKGMVSKNSAGALEYRVRKWDDVLLKSVDTLSTPVSSGSSLNSPTIAGLKFDFDALTTMSPSHTTTASTGSARSVGSIADAASAIAEVGTMRDADVQILDSIKPEKDANIDSDPQFASMNSGGGRLAVRAKQTRSSAPEVQCTQQIDSTSGLDLLDQFAQDSRSMNDEDAVFQMPVTPKRKSGTTSKDNDGALTDVDDETPVKRTRKTPVRKPRFASTPRKPSTRSGKGKRLIDWTASLLDDEAVEDDVLDDSAQSALDKDVSFASSIPDGASSSSVFGAPEENADASAVAEIGSCTNFSELADALYNKSGMEEEAEDGAQEE